MMWSRVISDVSLFLLASDETCGKHFRKAPVDELSTRGHRSVGFRASVSKSVSDEMTNTQSIENNCFLLQSVLLCKAVPVIDVHYPCCSSRYPAIL